MEYLFKAENIFKSYTGHQALNNVSIDVPAGSIFGLLGPNGAGKTTLIRIINQIIMPDKGQLYFDGQRLNQSHISRIAYLPEERGLYKKMKVGEQAIYLANLKGVRTADAKKKLRHWFEKFDILPWWDKKVEELSKGMQQKVQFIITVLHDPELLIFDEPFSGFDPINVNLLKEEILRLKSNGATIIFSTHNMSSVEELCDYIALINKSEKILDGVVNDVRKAHSTRIFTLEVSQLQGEFENIVSPLAIILHKEITKEGLIKARIKIVGNHNANDLIKHIIPNVQLHGFHENLPTMNDIFIKTVTGKYPDELNKDTMAVHNQAVV